MEMDLKVTITIPDIMADTSLYKSTKFRDSSTASEITPTLLSMQWLYMFVLKAVIATKTVCHNPN